MEPDWGQGSLGITPYSSLHYVTQPHNSPSNWQSADRGTSEKNNQFTCMRMSVATNVESRGPGSHAQ